MLSAKEEGGISTITSLGVSPLFLVSIFVIVGILSRYIAIVVGLVILILNIKRFIKTKNDKRSGHLRIKMTVATITIIILLLWAMDAPQIPNDYTETDLTSASPMYNFTYDLLLRLSAKDGNRLDSPQTGLTAEDVNTIEIINEVRENDGQEAYLGCIKENTEKIYRAWENCRKGKDIIKELSKCPEIADLTAVVAEIEKGYDENLNLQYIRHFLLLYRQYIYLQVEDGNIEDAVSELMTIDLAFRKFEVNARSITNELVSADVLSKNIDIANYIINQPDTPQKSVEVLDNYFQQHRDARLSFKNSIIYDYLTFKRFKDLAWGKKVPKHSAFFKINSLFRLFKNYCDMNIAVLENRDWSEKNEMSVWPALCPNLIHVTYGNVTKIYYCYNLLGGVASSIKTPVSIGLTLSLRTRFEIKGDLLRIVLNKRLGKPYSLKACAYSKDYIEDIDRKKIFSPGPDGEPNTRDDIELTINPKNLTN
ncbi:MAG: hypothetical protein ACYSWW_08880 [Planctomycetota bacterium]|jgi:hypothetical protein